MRELRVFFTSVVFFTRIPVPAGVLHDGDLLNEASRYLPVIGLIVGAVSALALWGSSLVLPAAPAVIVSMTVAVLLTGAFHEDGLADTADGFGGGWTVERKLEIMKDSRVGTYGAVTIVLSMLLRYSTLVYMAERSVLAACIALVTVHIGARLAPIVVMGLLSYVRLDETSKVKPIAKELSIVSLLFAVATAVLLSFLIGGTVSVLRLLLVPFISASAAVVFRRHIGGYTGDTLGAAEQLCELGLLCAAVLHVGQ